jgi:NADH-quinone oxidoreductase subunit L
MNGVVGLVVLLPAIAALVTLLIGHRVRDAAAAIGIIVTAVAAVCAVIVGIGYWGGPDSDIVSLDRFDAGPVRISFALHSSALVASVLVLATGVALIVQVYSVAYLGDDPRYPSYVALVLVFTSAMSLVAAAESLFVLLIGWEVMGICSYFLIGQHWEQHDAREGAAKAFLMTRLGDIGFLFGIFVLGIEAGTFDIEPIVSSARAGRLDSSTTTLATLLLLCGVVGKSAQFPLHSWLPDAMPGPTPITALIHAATMVAAGVFFVAELLPVFLVSTTTTAVLAIISAITMVSGALFAFTSTDLKRVLAWSTVSQLAYMFGALSVGGYDAGVLHLLSHGIFKALLFLAAGVIIKVARTQDLDELASWSRRVSARLTIRVTFVTMTVGLAALAGLPPLVGFFSKDRVLSVAVEAVTSGDHVFAGVVVALAGFVTTVLTAAYATRLWLYLFSPTLRERRGYLPNFVSAGKGGEPLWPSPTRAEKVSPLMSGPLVLLSVLAVGGSIFVVRPAFLAPSDVTGHESHLDVAMMVLSTVLVVVSIGLTYGEWWRADEGDPAQVLARARGWLRDELGWERYVVKPIGSLVLETSRVTDAGDRDVVETYVEGSVRVAMGAGQLVRWAHAGSVRHYLAAVVVGASALGLVMAMVAR